MPSTLSTAPWQSFSYGPPHNFLALEKIERAKHQLRQTVFSMMSRNEKPGPSLESTKRSDLACADSCRRRRQSDVDTHAVPYTGTDATMERILSSRRAFFSGQKVLKLIRKASKNRCSDSKRGQIGCEDAASLARGVDAEGGSALSTCDGAVEND